MLCVKQTKSSEKIEEPKSGQDILNIYKVKLSTFPLSDYSLRLIKMEKMTTTNMYNNRWDYKVEKI